MPSPLAVVFSKILTLSQVSAREISFFSRPRLERIRLALLASLSPVGSSVLILSRGRESLPLRIKSLSFTTEVSHCAAATTSPTRILPSLSESRISSVFLSKISPSTGQLRTVQSFWSSSPRWAISSPVLSFTRVTPPREQ